MSVHNFLTKEEGDDSVGMTHVIPPVIVAGFACLVLSFTHDSGVT